MPEINWGMGLAPDVGGNVMRAFEAGQQKRKQENAQNALAAYATNPNEQSLNALAPHNPGFVIEQRQALAKQRQVAEERQLVGAALNGDQQARQKLAYVNSEMYMKLDDGRKKAVDQMMGTIAQQAFSILQLPPQQQGPALQQALAGLQAQGVDVSTFKLTGNPTQDLKSALAMTGHLDEWEKFSQPNYTPVGENGLAGFQFGKPLNGADGKPQNFGPALPQGFVIDGGPTPPASGNFRP